MYEAIHLWHFHALVDDIYELVQQNRILNQAPYFFYRPQMLVVNS